MMNGAPPGNETVTGRNLRDLHGRVVLVKSSRDRGNPPTAIRGWIEVRETAGEPPEIRIAIDFPQMFTTQAHRRTIVLDAEALDRLLAFDRNGTHEFTIDDELR